MTISENDAPGARRNVALLSAAQAVVGSQQALIMAAGALVGVTLSPDPALATVPTTAMIIGLALAAGPAAYLIHTVGRTRAFMLGTGLGIVSGLIAAFGIFLGNFWIFSAALALAGASAAVGQQYRFAAADSVPAAQKGKAISWVLFGGVVAAFVGPGLAYFGRTWVPGVEYAGSFLGVAGLATLGLIVVSRTRLPHVKDETPKNARRSFAEIAASPGVFVPIISGMASYGLMTFVMVAAPLAMVVVCGHSKEAASLAIQWHILAMFAPSFVTGSLIARFGARAVTGAGLFLILGCALIALNGIEVWHFDAALILLGLGWNFGFIGSTALLAQGYRPEDAARAQALNEQLVFGVMAIASVSSGVLLQSLGWQAINVLVLPIATFALAMLAWGDWYARRQIAG